MALDRQAVEVQQCTITEPTGLHMRTEPNTAAAITNTVPQGTNLEFVAVVFGEDIAGNPRWAEPTDQTDNACRVPPLGFPARTQQGYTAIVTGWQREEGSPQRGHPLP